MTDTSFPSFPLEMTEWSSQQFDDLEVPLICQKAVIPNFRLLRQTVCVKKILRESQSMADPSTLPDALNISLNIIEDFDSNYGQFCDQCIRNFLALPETSKLSAGRFQISAIQ